MVILSRSIVLMLFLLLFSCSNNNLKVANKVHSSHKANIDSLIKYASDLLNKEDSVHLAIPHLDSAYQQSIRNNYLPGAVRSSYGLGSAYTAMSNVSQATSQFYISLKIAELTKDTYAISKSLLGLGLVMFNMNKWDNAIEYFNRSFELNEQIGGVPNSTVIYLVGISYYHLNEVEKANSFLDMAEQVAISEKDTMRLLEIRLNKNNLTLKMHVSDSILTEYQTLYRHFEESKERVGMCYALQGMANYYLKTGDVNEAVLVSNKSLEIAKALQFIYPLLSILNVVIQAEYLNGNYKAASDHLKDLQYIRDSVQSMNAASEVALISAEYQFDKKRVVYDTAINTQKRKGRLWLVIASMLFAVLLIFFYLLKIVSKERKNSDKLLLNILPKETAHELKKYGKSIAKNHENVTIVFADIRNFTLIAEGLAPNVIVLMLDKFFSAFDAILEKYGVEKIKTIGDAYMFVAGLNKSEENNAIQAVETCIEINKEIGLLNVFMQQNYGNIFEFRFGLHTGNVVSGVVGQKKYAFDIWGDAVNIAARMEAASEAGKINITENTYLKIKDKYHCTHRGEIVAKNKGTIKMFFVDSAIV